MPHEQNALFQQEEKTEYEINELNCDADIDE
jgi:hypothetical protein